MPNPLTKQQLLAEIDDLIAEIDPPAKPVDEMEEWHKLIGEIRNVARNATIYDRGDVLRVLRGMRRTIEGSTTGG